MDIRSYLKYNSERDKTADIMKGLAVIFMIAVHFTEILVKQDIYDSLSGKIFLFLGGPPAAPVFMAVMGYYMAVSKKTMLKSILRGFLLLTGGILLNIGLNLSFLIRNYINKEGYDPLAYIFGVDILIFAGIAVIIISSLKPLLKIHFLIPLVLALLVTFVPIISINKLNTDSSAKYIYAILGGEYFWSYFPVFPWLAYPLLGYSSKLLLQKFDLKKLINHKLFLLYWLIFAVLITFFYKFIADDILILKKYYHHNYILCLWNTGFLFLYSSIIYKYIDYIFSLDTMFYTAWLGKNVTSAYVIQWLIIGNLATFFYKSFDILTATTCFIIVLFLITFLVKTIAKR